MHGFDGFGMSHVQGQPPTTSQPPILQGESELRECFSEVGRRLKIIEVVRNGSILRSIKVRVPYMWYQSTPLHFPRVVIFMIDHELVDLSQPKLLNWLVGPKRTTVDAPSDRKVVRHVDRCSQV